MSRVSNEEIAQAYRETGSVWKAGRALGVSGQSVHERLVAMGWRLSSAQWTDEELHELRSLLGHVRLSEIASRLGRTYAGVACKVSEMGETARVAAPRKIPRGAGYDKVSVQKHMKALLSYKGPITRYARSVGLDVEQLAQAIQRVDQDWWDRYIADRSDIPHKRCPYCDREFIPSNGKQRYCSRKCGSDSRRDDTYFRGSRRSTVGLSEGVCQLCLRSGVKGLSSHHVLGRDNDPDGDMLIALCPGCHQIVGILAGRTFVDANTGWEELINLVMLRRHGHRRDEIGMVHTTVEVEFIPADDDEESQTPGVMTVVEWAP